MSALLNLWNNVVDRLEPAGAWIALLPIRLLMGYEFGKAGLMKFNSSDTLYGDVPGWFAGKEFMFPFSLFSPSFNWFAVTWVEIIGGIALFFGLFSRFWAFSLIILTIVAIFGVHWPDDWSSLAELWKGYAVTDKAFGNYRIPLLFLAMLFPLLFIGGGKLSLDYLIARKLK